MSKQHLANHITDLCTELSRNPKVTSFSTGNEEFLKLAKNGRTDFEKFMTPAQRHQLLENAKRHPDENFRKAIFILCHPHCSLE